MKKFQQLARYEIAWWQAHHRRQKSKLIKAMAKLYTVQFNLPYGKAVECIEWRVKAAKEHDIAEALEDKGRQSQANVHWRRAQKLLENHFALLSKVLDGKA